MTREELAAAIAKGFRGIVEKLESIDARLENIECAVVTKAQDIDDRADRHRRVLEDHDLRIKNLERKGMT